MGEFKVILMEDDRAPDARKHFIEAFNKETGGDFKKLVNCGSTERTDMCLIWDITTTDSNYQLKWCCDDPFYVLSKEVSNDVA